MPEYPVAGKHKCMAITLTACFSWRVANKLHTAIELAALAKKFRRQSGRTKAALAREFKVTRASMQDAEEHPDVSMTRLRIAIIEACSPYRVEGPLFALKRRRVTR